MQSSPGFRAALLLAANLLLFSAFAFASDRFLIHHHWVLPYVAVLLCLEYAALHRILAGDIYKRQLLWTALVTGLIGLGRFQTIYACAGFCAPKLAGMHLLYAGLFAFDAGRRERKGPGRLAAGIFLALALLSLVQLLHFK